MYKRDYPLFLIDRSKSDMHKADYVVCLDREVGFVARVLFLPEDEHFREFVDKYRQIENAEISGVFMQLKKGGIVLQVVDFLYHFEIDTQTKNRIQTLLKKGLKKYLHAEVERTPNKNELGIENQIKQQQLTVERARENYSELVKRANGDESIADYQIALAEETLQSLITLKEMKAFFTTGFPISFDPDDTAN